MGWGGGYGRPGEAFSFVSVGFSVLVGCCGGLERRGVTGGLGRAWVYLSMIGFMNAMVCWKQFGSVSWMSVSV